MISPGLLGAGPVRVMIDMLREANGPVTASEVLRGLAARPGQDGPASAADFFSAIVSAEARARAGSDGDDAARSGLRAQVRLELEMRWCNQLERGTWPFSKLRVKLS